MIVRVMREKGVIMSLKDLTAKIKEDAAFAENFKGLASVDAIVAKAKELGFELTDEEMAQMTALEKDERFADY